jgi:hypothetical protein
LETPGEFALRTYRLYRLDGAGKISAAEWIEAIDDEEAHLKAQAYPDTASYELWERKRLVGRVSPAQD